MACTGGLDRPILVDALVFYSPPVMPGVIRQKPRDRQYVKRPYSVLSNDQLHFGPADTITLTFR